MPGAQGSGGIDGAHRHAASHVRPIEVARFNEVVCERPREGDGARFGSTPLPTFDRPTGGEAATSGDSQENDCGEKEVETQRIVARSGGRSSHCHREGGIRESGARSGSLGGCGSGSRGDQAPSPGTGRGRDSTAGFTVEFCKPLLNRRFFFFH